MSFVSSFTYSKMNTNLEMLMQREQLMEDIISIITDYSDSGHICEESSDILQEVLCDAVCRNFPTN
jgi:hypothetical protein